MNRRSLIKCGILGLIGAVLSAEVIGITTFSSLDEKLLNGYGTDNFHGIRIIGSRMFIERTIQAIDYIERIDFESYRLVIGNLKTIEQENHWEGTRVVIPYTRLCSDRVSGAIETYASGLVHEAKHVELYRQGKEFSGAKGEGACIEAENQFLAKAHYTQIEIVQALETKYWDSWAFMRCR